MIYEYALEPEMVANWGKPHNYRFFIREFGLGKGRLVSRYPKNWARRVWEAFTGNSELDRKRMEELLVHLKETMVKRKDYVWDDNKESWLENALLEHERYPFSAILARKNPDGRPDIIEESDLDSKDLVAWDIPHGIIVDRKAEAMAAAISMMLSRCRWVKFIDQHISKGKYQYKLSLKAFIKLLNTNRPVGPPEKVEIHTGWDEDLSATSEFLRAFLEGLIPVGLSVTLYQWQERPGGPGLHNRYILTDLGGVAFLHGLDTGAEGEIDNIKRLDNEEYECHCRQYSISSPAFDPACDPLIIIGKLGG